VDLIDDERIVGSMSPSWYHAPGNSRRDDDDIPAGVSGCRLALSIDHSHAKIIGAKNRLGDWPDRECLAVPVPATIPNPLPAPASERISSPCCSLESVGM
jgi:hypothetical protein